jgi:ferrochelatase
MSKPAVLLIAHGSPERVEDIPEFLQNISRGRPLPEAVVREVQHRYLLIGSSPLTRSTGICRHAELASLHCRHVTANGV